MFDCTPQILIMCRDFIRRGAHYTPAALWAGDGGKISGKARLRDDAEHRPLQMIYKLEANLPCTMQQGSSAAG